MKKDKHRTKSRRENSGGFPELGKTSSILPSDAKQIHDEPPHVAMSTGPIHRPHERAAL